MQSNRKKQQCEVINVEGHPVIRIPMFVDGGQNFGMGVTKCEAILRHLPEIREFVRRYGQFVKRRRNREKGQKR